MRAYMLGEAYQKSRYVTVALVRPLGYPVTCGAKVCCFSSSMGQPHAFSGMKGFDCELNQRRSESHMPFQGSDARRRRRVLHACMFTPGCCSAT